MDDPLYTLVRGIVGKGFSVFEKLLFSFAIRLIGFENKTEDKRGKKSSHTKILTLKIKAFSSFSRCTKTGPNP